MSTNLIGPQPILPSNKDVALAEKSGKILSEYIKSTKTPTIQFINKKKTSKKVILPHIAVQLLVDILGQMGKGNAISLVSIQEELTTQEAADLLNVSRPYLIQLLENGEIPFRKIGTKRRILAKDVIRYKTIVDQKRYKALAALTKQAQKLKMGYE